ncbi:hypothetical protein E2C01_022947 [Portunus trituberculatus]|uniref:Uncharacterized protein n=1 Tax=Portunus trituberculatus TaxID=210409 RepID=A0A5B7E6S1_PORTR|nr:hypothetical protein [Portunus trituberculatus]
MKQEDYKAIVEDEVTLRPSNCHALTQVDCNAEVLDALPAEARKADFRLREVGKDITKAATIVVKSLTVLDKLAHDEKNQVIANEVAMLNGALALLGNAHYRNNLTRSHVIKRDINPKYSHVCRQGFHDRTPSSGEPRRSYPGQAWMVKNLRGRDQHNPGVNSEVFFPATLEQPESNLVTVPPSVHGCHFAARGCSDVV